MTLRNYCITYKNTQFYVWARNIETANAIALEQINDEMEIDDTGETRWEYDDYY